MNYVDTSSSITFLKNIYYPGLKYSQDLNVFEYLFNNLYNNVFVFLVFEIWNLIRLLI